MTDDQTVVTIPGLDTLPFECLVDYDFVTGTLRPAVDAALRASMIHTLMSEEEYEEVLTAVFHQVWEAAVNDRVPSESAETDM
ncbi:hypothetical protein [Microbacterium sp. SORGH_AS_0888]|uniref:hypothetical protein n=1 Tax=Microbacterium sp. SORGH_AS_0888 TaxID=3041791 RepID=UPI002780BFF3|nr:hypothetical protein [Microbacterium sp. SORGH_AS_0888]MDQ1130938.1 hypothetical protein [Microbacterium sp. SORGH_AS_0888]